MSAPNRTLAISFGIQMVYSMPTNATQWHTAPEIMGRRAIASGALADIYLPIETFLEDHGFDGRMCLLRSICEAAHSPFHHEDLNLLEEIVHAILTPSQEVSPAEADCSDNTQVMDYLPLEKQYFAAECVGKSGGDCDAAYPACPESPLDYISQTIQLEMFPE
ncbi:hypothetical protein B7P43_G06740 [Cryptotermes secundus]|uniref:Uncharacterized protein n=2 Tax=Cryptotermes secundus TaxID=105785 RepID=A0A2J7QZ93_9NEOP|nr:hypothetical protein B7P43_G06740 [Cryptotermes secundus]